MKVELLTRNGRNTETGDFCSSCLGIVFAGSINVSGIRSYLRRRLRVILLAASISPTPWKYVMVRESIILHVERQADIGVFVEIASFSIYFHVQFCGRLTRSLVPQPLRVVLEISCQEEDGQEYIQFSCPLTELYSEVFEIPSSLLFWRVPLRQSEDGTIVLENGQIISERSEWWVCFCCRRSVWPDAFVRSGREVLLPYFGATARCLLRCSSIIWRCSLSGFFFW